MIYSQRQMVLDGDDIHDYILHMIENVANGAVDIYAASDIPDEWDLNALSTFATDTFGAPENSFAMDSDALNRANKKDIRKKMLAFAEEKMRMQQEIFGEDMAELERVVLLKVVDTKWMDHIDEMDQLKQGIGLNAYAQRDPVVEYRIVGSDMYDEMIANIAHDTVKFVLGAKPAPKTLEREQVANPIMASHGEGDGSVAKKPATKKDKVGRNDPCPCGSGLKYKKCCGKDE